MKKYEYCEQYKDDCVECPCSRFIKGLNDDIYMICRFDLRLVKDECNRLLNERRKNDT